VDTVAGIEYSLAVDGVSVLMIALTGLLGLRRCFSAEMSYVIAPEPTPARFFSSWPGSRGRSRRATSPVLRVLEAMLVPMYLLVALLGGPRRAFAATKFFIYTTFGSLLMLVR